MSNAPAAFGLWGRFVLPRCGVEDQPLSITCHIAGEKTVQLAMPSDSRARLIAYLCQAGLSTARANAVVDDYTHELAEKIRKAWADHDAQKPGNVCMLSALNAADFIDTKTDSGDGPDEDESQILDGGHDFQWGHDHVQRCTRCTLPHSRWGGGLCPGPDHPLRPGEYV